ncbi:helix-turn-helix domain-containing protein [Arenimonas composti]|uniref:Cytoskeleton protein RodZ-like C-terminal domain-containing protein n=1 Tax=Arenimonas composti TR7-09 = DSM 18010 TaxID=1121013 RepID=A0A091BLQ1_9GAMM|nr:helix-turn-helix domain-containing protein [Arenimonas composti]KFN45250.1 hypothetical protein P873_02180 [Arenimonas composti TR7-09 = DSM 18010]
MNAANPLQPALFQDPLGVQLRRAREKAGLRVEQVAAQLRLPSAVVEAMEREEWSRLGARIYLRSYLGSYLRLLGLPEHLLVQVESLQPEAPALAPMSSRSRMRHTVDVLLRNGVYLVMTAVLVVPVWLVARHYQTRADVRELTLDAGAPPAELMVAGAGAAAAAAAVEITDGPMRAPEIAAPVVRDEAPAANPVLASLAPFPGAAADTAALVLHFRGESWVDVVGANGERIERGLVGAGAERRYDAGRVARITLGNADAVDVRHAGREVDLAPFRSANVARFAVSSDGQPAPAAH